MLYHNEPYDSCNLYGALQFASIIVFRLRRSKQNDKIWQSSDTMMLIVYAQKVCILHFGHLWNQRLLCRPVNLSPCAWAQSTLAVLSCPSSSSRLARRSSPRASPPETGTSFSVANICKWLNGCRWLQGWCAANLLVASKCLKYSLRRCHMDEGQSDKTSMSCDNEYLPRSQNFRNYQHMCIYKCIHVLYVPYVL